MPRRGLTEDQKERVGSYFARNYREGELVSIPERGDLSWKDWMEVRLKEIGFYDENGIRRKSTGMAPPRIFLRKDANKEEEEGLGKGKSKFDGGSLTGNHYEFKVWLQHKIEESRIGSGSLRILASESADSEFQEYDKTFNLLTKAIETLFNREILKVHDDSKVPYEVKKLDLISEVNAGIEGRGKTEVQDICKATVRSLISTSHTRLPATEEIFDLRDKTDPDDFIKWAKDKLEEVNKEVSENDLDEDLERVFTRDYQFPRGDPANNNYAERFERRIYNKYRFRGSGFKEQQKNYREYRERKLIKQRLCEENIDPEDDWNWVEITCPAIVIVPDLARRIEDVLSKSIKRLAKARESPKGKEVLGNLPKKDRKVVDEILENGIRPKSYSLEKTAAEAATHFSRKLAYNVITMLQNDGWLTTRSMEESEIIKQLYEGDGDRYDRYSHEYEHKNWPNVYRFEEKFLELFDEHKDRDSGKMTYAHFSRKSEHKSKMENAIFRYLRTSRSRWMYCLPVEHVAGTSNIEDLTARMEKEIEKIDSGAILIDIGEDLVGEAERKDSWRIEGGFIIRERDGRRTEMYKDRDEFEGFKVDIGGVKTDSRRCRPDKATARALNTLQSVQWEINLDLLEKLFDIQFDEDEGATLEQLRDRGEVGQGRGVESLKKIRRYIHNITPKKELLSGGNNEQGFFDNESLEEMSVSTLDWVKKIVNHNANVFWHAWYCDFRGRLYPRCTGLSPVGGDLSKSLIRFKKWKSMGKYAGDKRGINWFMRHLHNLMQGLEGPWQNGPAEKGLSFEARQEWVEANQEALREMGRNPLSEENKKRLGLHEVKAGKEDLQRIATLIEFDRIMEEYGEGGDWSLVKSGLPINLDGSCNGYQHISTLLRNPDLAKSVNVIPSEQEGVIGDLYSIVANAAKETGEAKALSKMLEKEMPKRLADEAIERIFSRNVAKKPTMTRAYGSTRFDRALAGRNQQGSKERSLPQRRVFNDREKEERNNINMIAPNFENSWFEFHENPRRGERHFAKHVKKKKNNPELKKIINEHTKGKTRKEKRAFLNKFGIYGKTISKLKVGQSYDIVTREDSIKESAYWEWKDRSRRPGLEEALVAKGEKWAKDFKEEETFQLWAQGSGLRSALISNEELWRLFRYSKNSPRKCGSLWKMQQEITKRVSKAYKDGIDDATGKAYKIFEESMKEMLVRSQGEYPGVRWSTKSRIDADGDGFEVSNYYMKADTKGGRGGWPSHPGSCYSDMGSIPDWYSEDKKKKKLGNYSSDSFSRTRIKERIEKFIEESGVKKSDEFSDLWERGNDSDRYLALSWLELDSGIPGSEDFAKKCKALIGHISITIPQYVENQFDMINASCGNKGCKWKSDGTPIETFDKEKRKEIAKKFLDEIGKCALCGKENLEAEYRGGRIDFDAAKRGICPNFIHSLDACHMRTSINQFSSQVEDVGFFAVHDSFGTHACDVEVMRKTVVRAFWEMHQGRSLDYWLSILEGPDGKLKKKSDVGVVKDKNLKEFKDKWNKSRYLIS